MQRSGVKGPQEGTICTRLAEANRRLVSLNETPSVRCRSWYPSKILRAKLGRKSCLGFKQFGSGTVVASSGHRVVILLSSVNKFCTRKTGPASFAMARFSASPAQLPSVIRNWQYYILMVSFVTQPSRTDTSLKALQAIQYIFASPHRDVPRPRSKKSN
jgi:hypothetical protein